MDDKTKTDYHEKTRINTREPYECDIGRKIGH